VDPYFHDAFISYAHEDKTFAKLLQRALQRYTPPRGLPVPKRRLNIFRDDTDLVGSELADIAPHLQGSRKLIVICSPNARASKYVNEEINYFTQVHSDKKDLLSVIIAGSPEATDPANDRDFAFPAALCEALKNPLASNYRDFDPKSSKIYSARYREQWHKLLAGICDALQAEIDRREERRRHQRRLRWGGAGAVISICLAIAAVFWAVTTFRLSVEQAERAVQQKNYLQALQSAIRASEIPHLSGSEYDQRDYQVVRETLAANQRLVRIMQQDGPIWAVAFDPTGELIASGSNDNTARLWNTRTGRAIGAAMQHDGPVLAVAFDRKGELLASGSQDKTVRLWDTRTGEPVGKPIVHDGPVIAVAFSPMSGVLVTASEDKTARLWDVRTGRLVATPIRHDDVVTAVAFDPTGERVVTGSEDNTARLWDVRTGQPLGSPMQHKNAVLAIAFSPSGELIATGSRDRTARLWNARTGEPIGEPMSHDAPVWAVAFNPGSETIATGSGDKTARLWKIPTCEPFGKPMQHDLSVRSVSFDPNGRFVITGSLDKTARLWDAHTGEPIGRPMQQIYRDRVGRQCNKALGFAHHRAD